MWARTAKIGLEAGETFSTNEEEHQFIRGCIEVLGALNPPLVICYIVCICLFNLFATNFCRLNSEVETLTHKLNEHERTNLR